MFQAKPQETVESERELLGAGGEQLDALLRGEFWDPKVLDRLEEKAREIPVPVDVYIAMLKQMSPEQFARDKAIAEARGGGIKREKVATQTGLATADVEVMTVSEQLEALKGGGRHHERGQE